MCGSLSSSVDKQTIQLLAFCSPSGRPTQSCGVPHDFAHLKHRFSDEEPSIEQFNAWRKNPAQRELAIYTYFAVGERTGLIKIGRSNFPWRRINELRNETSQDVIVAATVRDDFEGAYHNIFKAHRARGEWFQPHPDLLAEIDAIIACDPLCMIPPNERASMVTPSPAAALSNLPGYVSEVA